MLKSNSPAWRLIAILFIILVSQSTETAYSKGSLLKDNLSNVQITSNIASMPLAFTANQGQWDEKVSFRANANGATMWFTSDGAYYQFTRSIPTDKQKPASVDPMYDRLDRDSEQYETMIIKASFVGANSNPQMVGVDMMEYKCNYFIGNDPNE